MSFINKVALVTGASSGIGAAVALKFTTEGAKVAIVGRNEKKIKNIAEKCEQNGNKPLTIIADVSKDDNLKRIVSDTINRYGKLDVLVNNAGVGDNSTILADNAMEMYDKIMATNLRAVAYLTHLAAPHLVSTKGNIVNVSSTAGIKAFVATGFAYNASKAGLEHLSKTLAVELARSGVRVNSVAPGPVRTDIFTNAGLDEAQSNQFMEMLKKGTLLRKVSDPEEVADLILFLASEKARSITGSSYVIDNGALLK